MVVVFLGVGLLFGSGVEGCVVWWHVCLLGAFDSGVLWRMASEFCKK